MNKIEALVHYLNRQPADRFISSKNLAQLLGVTDRTIRNLIKQINEEKPMTILSSNIGYKLNQQKKAYLFSTKKNPINNRRFYILRRLFKSSERGCDLFDLADALYVSDATVRNDLFKINQLAKTCDLSLIQKENRFFLIGTEKNKRACMMQLLREQNGAETSFEADIQKFLDNLSLNKIIKVSQEAFHHYQVFPNTYFFQNFILHLGIAIDRSCAINADKKTSNFTDKKIVEQHSTGLKIIKLMTNLLHDLFNIELTEQDQLELGLLINIEIRQNQDTKDFIDTNVAEALNQCLLEVSATYRINFNDSVFKKRLLFHVQNLYDRANQNTKTRNFGVMDIKVKYPILFDIAVYMSSILSNLLDIEINEDEIAFLALHIGTFLDLQKQDDLKVKVLVITPQYLGQEKQLIDQIHHYFDEEIIIVDVLHSWQALDFIDTPFDLIIATLKLKDCYYNQEHDSVGEWVLVKEFISKQDFTKIRFSLEKIYHQRYIHFLQTYLPQFISEDLYIQLDKIATKQQLLNLAADTFIAQNYVDEDYRFKLQEREQLSTTSFPSKIAIPHTIKYDSKKTGIQVIKLIKETTWEDKQVALVLALAVKQQDTHLFNQIFPRIIEVIAESGNVYLLWKCPNYQEFIQKLIELMTVDDYYFS